jgi:hypothetical protein
MVWRGRDLTELNYDSSKLPVLHDMWIKDIIKPSSYNFLFR